MTELASQLDRAWAQLRQISENEGLVAKVRETGSFDSSVGKVLDDIFSDISRIEAEHTRLNEVDRTMQIERSSLYVETSLPQISKEHEELRALESGNERKANEARTNIVAQNVLVVERGRDDFDQMIPGHRRVPQLSRNIHFNKLAYG